MSPAVSSDDYGDYIVKANMAIRLEKAFGGPLIFGYASNPLMTSGRTRKTLGNITVVHFKRRTPRAAPFSILPVPKR